MTRGFAAAAANGWLDGTFATASCFVKLHTGDPGSAGATAAAAGDTTRKQATMAAASAGSKAASASVGPWTNSPGTSETLSDVSIWTAVTAGTFNASAQLTAPQAWASGNTFTLTALTFAITPIAA